ncbi:MAG TPA: cytochrome c biogenesis protein CcsA [Nitrolancea sp.]
MIVKGKSSWASGVGLWLGLLTAITMAIGMYLGLVWAPTDAIQGNDQRIFYIHVPMAWVAFLAFGVVFLAGIMYLWKRALVWDQIARSSAEIGLVFTTLVLVSGSFWGRPIWGTWWTWDARLTTTLLLWFIFLGYFMIRAYAGDRGRAATYSAVIGILGFCDVPIIYESVNWWRTLHPQSVINITSAHMPGQMVLALMVCLLAFTLFYGYLMIQKFGIERMKDQLIDYQYALSEREAEGVTTA